MNGNGDGVDGQNDTVLFWIRIEWNKKRFESIWFDELLNLDRNIKNFCGILTHWHGKKEWEEKDAHKHINLVWRIVVYENIR